MGFAQLSRCTSIWLCIQPPAAIGFDGVRSTLTWVLAPSIAHPKAEVVNPAALPALFHPNVEGYALV